MKNKLFFVFIFFPCLIAFSNVSIDFKNADVKDILRMLSEMGGLNIVVDNQITGNMTIKLKDVDIMDALNYIVEANNLTVKKDKNIIYIKKKDEKEAIHTEIKIIKLNYVNADDISKIVSKFLSPYGKIDIFVEKISGGWTTTGIATTTTEIGKKVRNPVKAEEKPRYLIVEDLKENVEKIEKIIKEIDVKKKELSIEVFFIEIDRDALKDIGVNFEFTDSGYQKSGGIKIKSETGNLVSTDFSGFLISYEDMIGSQLIAKIEALEQQKRATVLSNPRVVVIENQEAYILVGEKYPVLETNVTPGTSPVITESMRNYEPIGISLYVLPKVIADNKINLIIHPEVSELGDDVVGSTGVKYKRIKTREVDTEVNIDDGEVIVIGGLLKKEKGKTVNKVPFLGDIPLLGYIFRKNTETNTDKELLIFIIPKILKESISQASDLQDKMKELSK